MGYLWMNDGDLGNNNLSDSEFFERQKEIARELSQSERDRHAGVSIRHEKPLCLNCFCCACVIVNREMKEED